MTSVFNFEEFRAVYKHLVDHRRDQVRKILEAKVARINKIERKADRMSKGESEYVREEQELISLLNDTFYLQEEAMEKLFQLFAAIKDQNFIQVNHGAKILDAISHQRQFIQFQQKQIETLIELLRKFSRA